ncbi:hypothetical protein MIR68_005679 [Amoeboaphelidium protococcarum]|nr:hypothetical protein MIR68_005679 [Amoeboaphelidium protococcarum]
MVFELPPTLLSHTRIGPPDNVPESMWKPYHKGAVLNKIADWYSADDANAQSRDDADDGLAYNVVSRTGNAQSNVKSASAPGWGVATGQNTAGNKSSQQSQQSSFKRNNNNTFGGGRRPYDSRRKVDELQLKQRKKESSITIGADWKLVQEYQMFQFNKMTYDAGPSKPLSLAARAAKTVLSGGPDFDRDLYKVGQLKPYDRAWDRVTAKQKKMLVEKKLELQLNDEISQIDRSTALKDPILLKVQEKNKYISEDLSEDVESSDVVFVSSSVLAAIMALPRSALSWDIVVTKKTVSGKNKDGVEVVKRFLYLDKRDGSTLDYQFVHETAPPHPALYNNPGAASPHIDYAPHDIAGNKEHPWSPLNLAKQATLVSEVFSQVPLLDDGKVLSMSADSDSKDAKKTLSRAFSYRAWKMQPAKGASTNLTLVARTDADSYLVTSNEGVESESQVHIRALTEHFPIDPKSNNPIANYTTWQTKLQKNQKGAILASEMKSNSFVWARWLCEAFLGGVDFIKIGLFSRVNGARGLMNSQSDSVSNQYVLLGTQSVKCEDLAKQVNMDISNCWGIVKQLVDVFLGVRTDDVDQDENEEESDEVIERDAMQDGRFIIWRDPNAAKVRIYRLPEGVQLAGLDDEDEDEADQGDEFDGLENETQN